MSEVEIKQFKPSGKYYTTVEIEVEGGTFEDIITELRRKHADSLSPEFTWLVTGKGMPHEVPHLII